MLIADRIEFFAWIWFQRDCFLVQNIICTRVEKKSVLKSIEKANQAEIYCNKYHTVSEGFQRHKQRHQILWHLWTNSSTTFSVKLGIKLILALTKNQRNVQNEKISLKYINGKGEGRFSVILVSVQQAKSAETTKRQIGHCCLKTTELPIV